MHWVCSSCSFPSQLIACGDGIVITKIILNVVVHDQVLKGGKLLHSPMGLVWHGASNTGGVIILFNSFSIFHIFIIVIVICNNFPVTVIIKNQIDSHGPHILDDFIVFLIQFGQTYFFLTQFVKLGE